MLQPFDQDVEEGRQEHEEEESEAINPRVIRAPTKPSAQEVEAHMTTSSIQVMVRTLCARKGQGQATPQGQFE